MAISGIARAPNQLRIVGGKAERERLTSENRGHGMQPGWNHTQQFRASFVRNDLVC